MLGEVGVDPQLAAQAARHGHRDGEQRDVQRTEGEGEVAVQPRQPGAHVRVDGCVGEVDLEHAHAVQGDAGHERDVDLDRAGTDRTRVVRVRVEVRQACDDDPVRRVDGLVLGVLLEPRAVVGEHDVALQVAEPEPQDLVAAHGGPDERSEVGLLARRQVRAQRPPVEEWLDGGLGDQDRLGAALGHAAALRLAPVGRGEEEAENDDQDEPDHGIGEEHPRHRLALRAALLHDGRKSRQLSR